MKLRTQTLVTFIVVAGTVGYPFLAAMLSAIGITSSVPSIVIRSFIVLASAMLLARPSGGNGLRMPFAYMSLIAFWTVYLIRMTQDTLFHDHSLGIPASRYWMFALGASFLPLLALLFYKGVPRLKAIFKGIFFLSLIGLPLALLFADTSRLTQSGVSVDIGRAELGALNPISLGHFGGGLVLLSYWALRTRTWRRPLMLWSGLGIGSYGLLMSASRGPLLAVASALILFEFGRKNVALFALAIVAVLALPLATIDLSKIDTLLGVRVFSRFETFLLLSDLSSLGRLDLLTTALSQFAKNPIFGDLIEVRGQAIYPHNIFVESLMATGIVGTIPFILAIVIATYQAFRMLLRSPSQGWVAILFFQHLIGAQVSGALYTSGTLWVMTGLLLHTSRWAEGKQRPYADPGKNTKHAVPAQTIHGANDQHLPQ